MKAADRKVYESVAARSRGLCESCMRNADEMDHFFGRAKGGTTVAIVWNLCRRCHREKTDNRPSAVRWLERFIRHCARHANGLDAPLTDYFDAIDRASAMRKVKLQKFP